MNRKNSIIYTWIGVLSAVIILISANTLVNSYLNSQRLDLTEERMYTISSGTIETLQSIQEPINIKFLISKNICMFDQKTIFFLEHLYFYYRDI